MLNFVLNLQLDNLKTEFIIIGLNQNKEKLFAKKVTLYGSKDAKTFISAFLNKNWSPILNNLGLSNKASQTHILEVIDVKFSVEK